MENHFPVVVTCARLQDGKEIPCTLKAWCYDRAEQGVLWELRRIVDACGKGNSKVPLHKLVKTSWRQAEGEWKNVCETLGLEENWIVPSKRALGSKDGAWSQSADADLVRGEYSIKTLPMLCLLLHWATSSRAGAVKECCCFLFRRLLGTVLPTQVVRQLLNPLADNSYQQVCLQRDGLKPCAHVQQCLSHVESGLAGDELWRAFLRVLTSCYTFLEECPALKRALAAMLQSTAAKLDEALPAAGSLDVFEGLTNDPSKHKRRRVDEDVRKEAQKRAAEDNLTTGVFAKTHKVADNSVAWKWDHQDGGVYLKQCHAHFQDIVQSGACVTLTADAKRLGNPAQDLVAGIVTSSMDAVAAWLPPQAAGQVSSMTVLPDFASKPLSSSLETAEEKELYARQLDEWLAVAWKEHASAKPVGDPAAARRPNQHWLLALEHGLQACTGLSFKDFLPLRRPRSLKEHERRYRAKLQVEGQLVERCAMYNEQTKKTELEFPLERTADGKPQYKPSLVICIDQGSVGWPAVQFLFQHCGLCGYYAHDPWHRCWNDLRASMVEANFWPVIREMTVCMNVRSGPFEKAAFFGQMQDSMDDLQKFSDFNNPFFLHCYPGIVAERGLSGDLEVGTAAHMAKLFAELCHDASVERKGEAVKWARWGSFWDAGMEFRKNWHCRLMTLLHFGWRAGWWPSVQDSPLLEVSPEDLALAGLVTREGQASGQDAGGSSSKSVKNSNEQIQHLRQKCRNGLELATIIMANQTTERMFNMVLEVGSPVRAWLGQSMARMQKGPDGPFTETLAYSCNVPQQVLAEVWQTLRSRDALQRCGFEPEHDEEALARALDEEDELAARMVLLAQAVTGQRAYSMAEYTDSPPFVFLPLLHDDLSQRDKALKRLEGLWQRLMSVEKLALADTWFLSFKKSLTWAALPSIRGVFITLEEHRWTVPEFLSQHLQTLFSGLLHTKTVEECFNELSDDGRKVKSAKVEKLHMWQTLVRGELLHGLGYSPPPTSPAIEQDAPKKLPPTLFKGTDASKFSLGGKAGLQEMACEDDWASLNPNAHSLVAWATKAMETFADPADLKVCWVSLLAQPGTVLWSSRAPADAVFVLKATSWGVLGWRVIAERAGGTQNFKFFSLKLDGQDNLRHVLITTPNGWSSAKINVRSPLHVRSKKMSPAAPSGILLQLGSTETLLQSASKAGFKGLTVFHLGKLFTKLGVQSSGKKPTLLADLLMALTKHVWPRASEADLRAYCAQRDTTSIRNLSSIITSNEHNLDLAAEFMDDDDAEKCKEEKRKTKQCKVPAEQPHETAPLASLLAPATPKAACAKSASSKQATSTRKQQLAIDWKAFEASDVRKWIPDLPKITVARELKLAKRWRVTYPRQSEGPKSFSMVYHDQQSEEYSVKQCLLWLWRLHEQETGSTCPYEL
ncbi:unnamed protein product [Symbiodinium sp. CCMP2456]|nr:unnamed protein product [Symbiodinium sp. CCMP2456]